MLSPIEEIALSLMITGFMLGIGCTIQIDHIKNLTKQKKSIFFGLLLQYTAMPTLAVVISYLFKLPEEFFYVFLLISCCPGGTTSNMFSYYSKGDVALSITLTAMTSFMCFIMTPTLFFLFSQTLSKSMTVTIPFSKLIPMTIFTVLPIICGIAITAKSSQWGEKIEIFGKWLGYLSIILMSIVWLPKLKDIYLQEEKDFFIVLPLLSFLGIFTGLLMSTISQIKRPKAKTISFETGIQNAPLAFAVVTMSLPSEFGLKYGWAPLVYGACSVASALIYTIFYRRFLK